HRQAEPAQVTRCAQRVGVRFRGDRGLLLWRHPHLDRRGLFARFHHAEHVATLTKHLEELKKAEETHARQAPDVKHYLEQMVARQEDILRRIRVLEHPAEQYKGFVGKLCEAALTLTVCAMVFAVGLGWMLCWWYLHR